MRLGWEFGRFIVLFLGIASLVAAQPTITNITNAAFPSLDAIPDQIFLASRSIGTIWGTDLADSTVAIAPPWQTNVAGTEVHLVSDFCDGADCDQPLQLLFASPNQINFLTPFVPNGGMETGHIVLVRDGVQYSGKNQIIPGVGEINLSPDCDADCSVVFQVGYDCLFSFGSANVKACGLSWDRGDNRAPLGAITDASGNLITSENPVHQGEVIVLWMTGLPGIVTNNSGVYVVPKPQPIGFGISQAGKDIPATIGYNPNGGYAGTFFTPAPLFAGESPQFPGLDQVNVAFPTCVSSVNSKTESRYDAWLPYANFVNGTYVRIYVPFEVRAGDPACEWK